MYTKLSTLCLLLFFVFSVQAQKLTQVWESEKVLDTPESVIIYDGMLYISNIGGKDPMAKDGYGFISKMDLDGKVTDMKWIDGLNAPKGIYIAFNKFYVADINQVKIFDKNSGNKLEEITIEGAIFLNDLIVTDEGEIIISDYKDTKIYSIKDKAISVLVKDERLDHVNGLDYSDSRLLAGTNSQVFKIDLTNGVLDVWSDSPVWIDGIEPLDEGRVLVSDWGGKIVLIAKGEAPQVLIELDDKEYNTADMDYDPKSKRAYIPTFFRNSVICFQYED